MFVSEAGSPGSQGAELEPEAALEAAPADAPMPAPTGVSAAGRTAAESPEPVDGRGAVPDMALALREAVARSLSESTTSIAEAPEAAEAGPPAAMPPAEADALAVAAAAPAPVATAGERPAALVAEPEAIEAWRAAALGRAVTEPFALAP